MGEITKVVECARLWLGAERGDYAYDEILTTFNENGKYKADTENCCEFVCACFIKALGLARAKELIPIINYAKGQVALWNVKNKVEKPIIGDIVYYGFPVNHVEIVIETKEKHFITVDGNYNHKVVKRERLYTDSNINCIMRPEYKDDKDILMYTWKNAVIESVTLKKYNNGSLVLWMQKYLQSKGFYLDGYLDGVFGVHMENAVKQWQKNNNLYVDGVVGKYCWTFILK